VISIDDSYVTAVAPNPEAAKNGRALVLKKKFTALNISRDQSLIFGQCQGSGRIPYSCSSDFAKPDAPVHRCNCPSRQFPCKHCVGLMFAYVQDSAQFKVADVPEDLQAKRDKAEARAEKKKAAVGIPKKVNKPALAKKIKAQLDGLDLLERLTRNLVSIGIGNMNAKSANQIEEQAKQLGDAYLPGAQSALRAYTSLFSGRNGRFDDAMSSSSREAIYGESLDRLSTLHALVKQGRAYLEKRLADPELQPETDSSIAAWLGHAWQLAELRDAGQMQPNVELMQLAFNTHDDVARNEWIDTGIWVDIGRGSVYTTKNYRPYHAAKFIKADDSFFEVAQIPELFVYPGDMNQRVRWERMTSRPAEAKDFAAIWRAAEGDFAVLVKRIKGNLKGPLSEKQPVCLLKFQRIGTIGETFVAEDAAGNRLTMTDRGIAEEPPSLQLLRLVPTESLRDQVLVARFRHDLDSLRLEIKPLGIVTKGDVVRLTL
jgi:hypothetical protein